MSIQIRKATAADAANVQAFLADLWAESLDVIYSRPAPQTVAEVEAFIQRIDETPNSIYLVAVSEGRIVGCLDLHGSAHEQKRHCAGFGMCVTQQYRGRGVGRALMSEMLARALSFEGLVRIELQVFDGNTPAIGLYEKFGFEEEGRRRSAVLVKGNCRDVILMSRLLRP